MTVVPTGVPTIILAGLVVALGALVQGTVGFGLALVAAPLLAIVEPALIPVPLLVVAPGIRCSPSAGNGATPTGAAWGGRCSGGCPGS